MSFDNSRTSSKPAGSILTTWEISTYDVWGNPRDGYEVNDVFRAGAVELRIPQTRFNVGTAQEFVSAFPSDRQIRSIFGIERVQIETDGDDLNIEVQRKRDGYPIGGMFCTSHCSLSPVRKWNACIHCGGNVDPAQVSQACSVCLAKGGN
jgi:hypothetical protein